MSTQPQTWHYGLIAQHWAEFENHSLDAPDVAYYREQIERYGEPALDLACGTGRLLLDYLQDGLDVDGCDISPDMVAGFARSRLPQVVSNGSLHIAAEYFHFIFY